MLSSLVRSVRAHQTLCRSGMFIFVTFGVGWLYTLLRPSCALDRPQAPSSACSPRVVGRPVSPLQLGPRAVRNQGGHSSKSQSTDPEFELWPSMRSRFTTTQRPSPECRSLFRLSTPCWALAHAETSQISRLQNATTLGSKVRLGARA